MILSALPVYWRARASQLDAFSPPAAQAFREAADLLEESLASAEASVTLKDASVLGGYSVDALQRLVATGRIENAGRKGRPRIRLVHVPRKPGHQALLQNSKHCAKVQPTAVVASVIAR